MHYAVFDLFLTLKLQKLTFIVLSLVRSLFSTNNKSHRITQRLLRFIVTENYLIVDLCVNLKRNKEELDVQPHPGKGCTIALWLHFWPRIFEPEDFIFCRRLITKIPAYSAFGNLLDF